MPPTPTKTKPPAKRSRPRRTTGERDRARSEPEFVQDDSLERRYHRQQQRARDRGEPTSMAELDQLERQEGRQEGRAALREQARLSNLPSGSLGVGNVLAPLLVETVLITADEFIRYHRWPIPSRFLAAYFIFGGLSLATGPASRAASATAWGLVLATTYAFVSGSPNSIAGIGNFFGGKVSPASVSVGPIPNASPPTTAQRQPFA